MSKTPEQIVKEAEALVQQAQQSLDASDAFYRAQGLDPAKVKSVLAAQATDKDRAEAQATFQKDLDAVEREVAEEAARLSFAQAPASSGARKPRNMV
jgi:hypothetical protein